MENKAEYKVFLVDDDSMVRRTLLNQFKGRDDLEIHSFGSGEECIENLELDPNIVVLDYHMRPDGLTGLETLMHIQENKPEIQVAMLSSQDKIPIAVELLKKGAKDYIVKNDVMGINTENVVNKLLESLKLKAQINELYQVRKRDKKLIRIFLIGNVVMILIALLIFFL